MSLGRAASRIFPATVLGLTLRSGAKRIATRHELGILRNRQPATDEYPVVGHVYDFALRGNASNAIRDEKTSLLHLEPPKQEKKVR